MRATWRGFLVAGGAASLAAALLPEGPAPFLLNAVVGGGSLVAVLVGLRRHRPSRPMAWRLLAVAIGAWLAGDLVFFGWGPDQGWGASAPAIAAYVVAYAAAFAGLTLLVGSRGPARRAEGRIDSAIVMANLAVVSWVAFVEPGLAAAAGSMSAAAVAVAYPLANVLLLGVAVRLGIVSGGRVSARLLLVCVVLLAVTDAGMQVASAADGGASRALALGWVLSYVALGAAALHPSMRELSDVDLTPADLPGRGHLAILFVAAMALPATGVWQVLRGDLPWAPVVVAPVVVALVGARVVALVGRLARQAARLADVVETDHTTGLPTRGRLSADLDALLTTPGRAGVLLVGIEHLAEVAELVGHAAGEDVLRATGRRLRAAAGPGAVVARASNANFAVIDQAAAAPTRALVLAERLRSAAERPHALGAGPVVLDVAVGAVLVPQDARTAATALRLAEVALVAARERPDHVALFTPDMAGRLPSAVALREIRQALEGDEIALYYQPQVDLVSGQVVGLEALARWVHPSRGLVPPSEFLPLVERGDMVDRFTARVLEMALDQCATWRADGHRFSVAVNLSARNLLDPHLPAAVELGLTTRGLPTSVLELELTETGALEDPERALRVLDELAGLGVALAVDDYGTGYSSLAYLRRLPARRLKIDRSFVVGLTSDEACQAIVVSTLDLARDLGLDVVAEGVEDDATLLRLRDLGCACAQGFGIGPPVPPGEVLALVRSIETRLPGLLAGGWEPGLPGSAAPRRGSLPVERR